MRTQSTIKQRVNDFRGFCASKRIMFKDVTARANLNYRSVVVNMNKYEISDKRMTKLEEAAIELHEEKETEELTV